MNFLVSHLPGKLQYLLDHVYYKLNNKIKWSVHMTVQGPFEQEQKELQLAFSEKVTVFGLDLWNNQDEFLVVLLCESKLDERIWKPDWPEGKLHITLFKTNNKQEAEKVYEKLSKLDLYFSFQTNKLEPLKKCKYQFFNVPGFDSFESRLENVTWSLKNYLKVYE